MRIHRHVKPGGEDNNILDDIMRSVERLDAWIQGNGWAGYDPYDVRGTRLFLRALALPKTSLVARWYRKLILGPLIVGEALFPKLFRVVLDVQPSVNAKGMALFARAYLNLFTATGRDGYRQKAIACLEWLLRNPSAGYQEPCWGYPFDWDNGVMVPALTPASVVSAAACEAFWAAWRATGNGQYLETCCGVCRFFVDKLNVDQIDDDTVCFSYTPLDHFHVHNANLMVGELLVRVGRQVGRHDWVTMGLKAANYALREQNHDGSLFYWGRVQNNMNPDRIDHYHSGFEMRCLYGLWKSTGMPQYKTALDRYYGFYDRNLLQQDGGLIAPMMYPGARFPVNIHSCAEGLMLNSTLAPDCERAREVMLKMAPWVISRMQADAGHFVFMRRRYLGVEWLSRIPYIRWGQAWMLLALSQVVLELRRAGGQT